MQSCMHLLPLPDVALVVGQECHSICGKVLQVCYAPGHSAAEEKQVDGPSPYAIINRQLLLISNIPDDVNKDYLTLFVEIQLGLEEEKDFTLDFQPPRAHLAFSSERGNMWKVTE